MKKFSPENVRILGKNTFEYAPNELFLKSEEELREFISNDTYKNQYIFFATKLPWTFEFCNNTLVKNYILVCDIDENILNQYIGVGRYHGNYRIEFRLPRRYINTNNIIDILYFEPFDDNQIDIFSKNYNDYFYVDHKEKQEKTITLMKEKK